jgi:hypothetical protein
MLRSTCFSNAAMMCESRVNDRNGDIEVFVAPSATDVDPNATMHNMKENAKEAPNDRA